MTADKMKWFRDARFGLFIHWGIYAVPAQGEWVMYGHDDWDYEYPYGDYYWDGYGDWRG